MKGVVRKVWKKGAMTSLVVDDGKGEEWYGCGRKSPACSEGDVVEFDFQVNGKFKNIEMDTFKVVQDAPKNTSGSNGGVREDYWQQKASRDVVNDSLYNIRASSMMAKDIVLAAYSFGDLKLSATEKKNPDEILLARAEALAEQILLGWMSRLTEAPTLQQNNDQEQEEVSWENI